MHGNPLCLFAFTLLDLFKLVDSNLGIKGAGSDDDAILRTCPPDFPRCSSLDIEYLIFHPLIAFLDKSPDGLIAADCGQSTSSPIKAHVIYDDIGR